MYINVNINLIYINILFPTTVTVNIYRILTVKNLKKGKKLLFKIK